jgi:sulfonate transport system permease protein
LSPRLRAFVGVIGLLIVWWLVSKTKVVDPIFMPGPDEVVIAGVHQLLSQQSWEDIGFTLYRLVVGFSIGSVLGIVLGLMIGAIQSLYQYLEVPIDFFRSIPVACLFPFFMILFGLGDASKIGTAAWTTTFVVLINTVYGVRFGSDIRLKVAKTMRSSTWKLYAWIILPQAAPHILVGMRTGISLAIIVVLVTEMFMGTRLGIGKRIYDAALIYDTPTMFLFIIISGGLGYVLNKLFLLSEYHLTHWTNKV